MSWLDAITLASRSIGRRLGRAVLTVLAVGLAAALLSSLLIASTAAQRRVLDQVSNGGPLAGIEVAAAAPDPGALDSDDPPRGAARDIDDAARRRIERLPGVASVVPITANPAFIVPPADPLPGAHPRDRDLEDGKLAPYFDTMVGADFKRAGDLPVAVLSGRLPQAGSLTEAAVTLAYLRRLGLPKARAADVVGSEIQVGAPRAFSGGETRVRGRWVRLQIVGVVAQELGTGDLVVPIQQAKAAREWALAGVDPARFDLPTSPYTALVRRRGRARPRAAGASGHHRCRLLDQRAGITHRIGAALPTGGRDRALGHRRHRARHRRTRHHQRDACLRAGTAS